MSKYPLKTTSKTPPARKPDSPIAERVPPAFPWTGFFRFHYTSTELTSQGGRTHVKARHTRLEDGRLHTESFEGELPAGAYDEAVRRTQQQMLGLMRSLAWWLPPVRGKADRE